MMHAYDKDHAARLVPLLESIVSEVAERRRSIRDLERTLAASKRDGETSSPSGTSDTATGAIVASLAIERRELRLANKELERLGCSFDEHNPNRVIIPGTDGVDSGFHWHAGETEIQANASESSVF